MRLYFKGHHLGVGLGCSLVTAVVATMLGGHTVDLPALFGGGMGPVPLSMLLAAALGPLTAYCLGGPICQAERGSRRRLLGWRTAAVGVLMVPFGVAILVQALLGRAADGMALARDSALVVAATILVLAVADQTLAGAAPVIGTVIVAVTGGGHRPHRWALPLLPGSLLTLAIALAILAAAVLIHSKCSKGNTFSPQPPSA